MILIDPLADAGKQWTRGSRLYSHMASDIHSVAGLEELHAFARRLGLRREWFQDAKRHPHYDLTPPRRLKALALGAVEVPQAEFIRRANWSLLEMAGRVAEEALNQLHFDS